MYQCARRRCARSYSPLATPVLLHTHRSTTQAALRQLEGVEVHGQKVMVRDDTQLVASRGALPLTLTLTLTLP